MTKKVVKLTKEKKMIATHAPKIFNAKLKASGLTARIDATVPDHIICSKTTTMQREFWGCPVSAGDIKHWRQAAEILPKSKNYTQNIPNLTDTHLKQIILPTNWAKNDYVSVTPVASMGVLHELHHRVYEMNLPYKKWVIQPNSSAWANHGEAILSQKGALRLLRRGAKKNQESNWTGDFVQLTARCERMNVSGGMISVGFPAITAIGGLVHSLERLIEADIEFALGIKYAQWLSGVPKITTYKRSQGAFHGRTKSGKIEVRPGYITEEIVANCEIVLLLRTKADKQALAKELENKHRLAGGDLFDVKIAIIKNEKAPVASYLRDASIDLIKKREQAHEQEQIDTLQTALEMYGMHGEWRKGKWHQPEISYTLNQTGYAFLEIPTSREGSRNNYPHAWAEPVFSLITQNSMNESCWWERKSAPFGIIWEGRQSAE